MACCIFVKEGVVEQKSAVGDGGVHRNKGAFAEVVGAFIHLNHLGQHVVVLLCMPLDCFSFLEPDPEVLDQNAHEAKRLCCIDNTLSSAALGGGEALL